MNLSNCIKAGLAVSSYNGNALNVSSFEGVQVNTISSFGGNSSPNLSIDHFADDPQQETIVDRDTKLADFNAYKEELKVRLDWFTAQEYLNNLFEIEKSTDGENFEKIGEISSKTFADNTEDYFFYDETPSFGLNYYRIKQIGLEEDEQFSEVKTVDFNMELESLNVYPNPADREVWVYDERFVGLSSEIELVNSFGIELQRFEIEEMAAGAFKINLDGLPDGIYFIRVKTEGFRAFSRMFTIARK